MRLGKLLSVGEVAEDASVAQPPVVREQAGQPAPAAMATQDEPAVAHR